jgi:hypothetical protein
LENRALRKVFERKVEELTRDSGDQMRMRWTGHVARRGRGELRTRFNGKTCRKMSS